MKQYCRYCIHLCPNNGGIWCEAKEKLLAESTTKTANKCKLFECCEGDAYLETEGYRPRQPRQRGVDEVFVFQRRLEEA